MQGESAAALVRLFVLVLIVAAAVILVARRLRIPDAVGLVVLGVALALFLPDRAAISPDVVLLILLPGLVFEASYRLRIEDLRRSIWVVTFLAIPGVLLTAGVVALALSVFAGIRLDLAFLVGTMVSATDPASVIATFAKLKAPRSLAALVQAESLFNDGTGLVIFAIALTAIEGSVSIASGAALIAVTVVGSLALGALLGFAVSRVLASFDDHPVEAMLSIALAYGAYMSADAFGLSGIISTVTAGVVLGNYGQAHAMSERTRAALDVAWEIIAFVLTTLVFVLIGISIRLDDLVGALAAIGVTTAAVVVGRAFAVYGLIGGTTQALRRVGRQRAFPPGWLHVLFWSGLRGAVAVAMALSLPLDLPQRAVLQATVFGVVILTLFVQGTTAPLVVRAAIGEAREPGP